MRLAALALVACGGPPDPVRLLDADPSRDGLDGADGPYGVAAIEVHEVARATGQVPVRIVYPADADLAPAVREAPLLVILQGARVVPDRYDWLATHLASRGLAVALPRSTDDLAIFEPGDAEVARRAVRDRSEPGGPLPHLVAPDAPTAVAGHSLGGVMAARAWVNDPDLDGLVLLASYPAASDPVEDDGGRPVLALCGTEDGYVDHDTLSSAIQRFPGPVGLGFVAGMNHFSWTDDPSPGELARDGTAVGSRDEERRDAQRAIDPYLDAVFRGDRPQLGLPSPGIRWAF